MRVTSEEEKTNVSIRDNVSSSWLWGKQQIAGPPWRGNQQKAAKIGIENDRNIIKKIGGQRHKQHVSNTYASGNHQTNLHTSRVWISILLVTQVYTSHQQISTNMIKYAHVDGWVQPPPVPPHPEGHRKRRPCHESNHGGMGIWPATMDVTCNDLRREQSTA